MKRSAVLGAVDVGSSKVCTLLAEITPDEDIRLLGVGVAAAQGVRKGLVDNIKAATEAIAASIERAERASGMRLPPCFVSISGNHLACLNHKGVATVPGGRRAIRHEDIRRALEDAQAISLPSDREVLHIMPRSFVLDGQETVSDPIGMFGQRLDVEVHLVTASVTAVQNLCQALEGAGVQVEALVASPLAAAEAVLEEEEKRHGVVVVDIGGGTTDVVVFLDGMPYHTASLPVGGYHFTHDLVLGLRVPFSVAEEAKLRYGAALPSRINPEETIELESFGGQRHKSVPRRRLAEILQARAEEVLEMVYLDVRRAGFDDMIAAGLVLTGGTATLPGLDELAEQLLHVPVRIGLPKGTYGLADAVSGPAYAASVGLLRWAAYSDGWTGPSRGRRSGIGSAAATGSGLWERLKRWLKILVPQ
ncbi:MAG TPA: cell division protein FtsA [Dehalococcoidia bacterium]|nr:cell division protein FtsA [Dehalococcoidia bacterium]